MKLDLDIDEIKRYINYEGKLDEITKSTVNKAVKLVEETVRPKYVLNYFPIKIEDSKIEVEKTIISWESNSLAKHLENCHSVVLLLVTLGSDLDQLIKRLEITDISLAFVVNAVAGEYLEKYIDYIQDNEINSTGYLTSRFSIGYGDLDIEYQDDFVKVLEGAKRIGINVLPSHLMVPSKSVSAIIGLSDKPVNNDLSKCPNCLTNGKCSGKCIERNV